MDYLLSAADYSKLHLEILLFIGIFEFVISDGKFREKIAKSLLICWIYLVLAMTILSRDPYEGIHFDFIPFWKRGYFSVENRLNIFLLMPIGFLLPMLKKKWWQVFLIGLFCTLSIETLQYITKTGWFDINDIMFNELGIIIGWGIYKIIFLIRK